jgi:glutathione S-transferase
MDGSPARPLVLADRGCPFAHRVFALLAHLGVEVDCREVPAGQQPDGLVELSPSGRVPLLVHGAVVIGESRVMLEHLAEVYGFESSYPRDLDRRTLHRHAMAVMDGIVAPRLFRADAAADARLSECLDAFEHLALEPPEPCLLTFHLAPLWLRFQWWRPEGAVTQAIRARRTLAAWLDGAAALAAVARTAPDAGANTADFQRMAAASKASFRTA